MFRIPYCFKKDDIISNFKNDKQFYNWINNNIKNERIKRVRNGLYVTLDSMGSLSVNRFEIASRITETAFIAYHSALEFYGLANQVFNIVIVGSQTRFYNFEFEEIGYEYENVKNYYDIHFNKKANARVPSLERTIIDCIDNVNLAGGIEELLYALGIVVQLDEKKLLGALASYDSVFLYKKTGYILEHFREWIPLSDSFFAKCEAKVNNSFVYFLKDEYSNIVFNSKWKIMAPENLFSKSDILERVYLIQKMKKKHI